MSAIAHLRTVLLQADAAAALREVLETMCLVLESELVGGEFLDALDQAHTHAREILDDTVAADPPDDVPPWTSSTVAPRASRPKRSAGRQEPAPLTGIRACESCGKTCKPKDFPRAGAGWSKSCRSCVSAKNKRGAAKRFGRPIPDENGQTPKNVHPNAVTRTCIGCRLEKPDMAFPLDSKGERRNLCRDCNDAAVVALAEDGAVA